MKIKSIDVSIILINYNTYEFTVNMIDSIISNTKNLDYEIILIDNNSPDGSGIKLKNKFCDRIKYIQAGDNLGTSKAFNIAFSNSSGEYIIWMNTDMYMNSNFIGELYKFMESNSDCGVAGGNLYDYNDKPNNSFFNLPTLLNEWYMFSFLRHVQRKYFKNKNFNYTNSVKEVGFVIGADMMVRRDVFDKVGLLDENIFMYYEDSDFCYRVHNETNYKVCSVPWAKMYHIEGGSNKSKTYCNKVNYIAIKSGAYYFEKHYSKSKAKKYLTICKCRYIKILIYCILKRRDNVPGLKKIIKFITQLKKDINI